MKPVDVIVSVSTEPGQFNLIAKPATSISDSGECTEVNLHLTANEVRSLIASTATPDEAPAEPVAVSKTFGNDELDYVWNILEHKGLVQRYMQMVATALFERAVQHDYSKFGPDEFWAYASALPRFKEAEYGSEEYFACCRSIAPAIRHHVTSNRHHPEYHANGVNDMTLIDVIEMVCDWIAASQRVAGDTLRLDIQQERFQIGEQLQRIIENTVRDLSPQSIPQSLPEVAAATDTGKE